LRAAPAASYSTPLCKLCALFGSVFDFGFRISLLPIYVRCSASFAVVQQHTPYTRLDSAGPSQSLSSSLRQHAGVCVNFVCQSPLSAHKQHRIDRVSPQDFFSALLHLLFACLSPLARNSEVMAGKSTTAPTASNPVGLPTSVRAEVTSPGPTSTANAPRTTTTSRAMRCPRDTVSAATLSRCVACGWRK